MFFIDFAVISMFIVLERLLLYVICVQKRKNTDRYRIVILPAYRHECSGVGSDFFDH